MEAAQSFESVTARIDAIGVAFGLLGVCVIVIGITLALAFIRFLLYDGTTLNPTSTTTGLSKRGWAVRCS